MPQFFILSQLSKLAPSVHSCVRLASLFTAIGLFFIAWLPFLALWQRSGFVLLLGTQYFEHLRYIANSCDTRFYFSVICIFATLVFHRTSWGMQCSNLLPRFGFLRVRPQQVARNRRKNMCKTKQGIRKGQAPKRRHNRVGVPKPPVAIPHVGTCHNSFVWPRAALLWDWLPYIAFERILSRYIQWSSFVRQLWIKGIACFNPCKYFGAAKCEVGLPGLKTHGLRGGAAKTRHEKQESRNDERLLQGLQNLLGKSELRKQPAQNGKSQPLFQRLQSVLYKAKTTKV